MWPVASDEPQRPAPAHTERCVPAIKPPGRPISWRKPMRLRTDRARLRTAIFAGVAAIALPCSTQALSQIAQQINLVTDDNTFLVSQGFTAANTVDPNLINPWGMSFSGGGPFWISNQGTR